MFNHIIPNLIINTNNSIKPVNVDIATFVIIASLAVIIILSAIFIADKTFKG